jgi:hypothetical protein
MMRLEGNRQVGAGPIKTKQKKKKRKKTTNKTNKVCDGGGGVRGGCLVVA